MQNYTVIIASAYGDDSADIYVVLAPSPKAACDHVQALDAKLKDRPRSVLFLMDGEVRFQPTLFNDEGIARYDGPTVIDLRPAWSQEPSRLFREGSPTDLTRAEQRKVTAGTWSTADEAKLQARRAARETGKVARHAAAAKSGPESFKAGLEPRQSKAEREAAMQGQGPVGRALDAAFAPAPPPKRTRRMKPAVEAPPAPPAAPEPLVSAGGRTVRRRRGHKATPGSTSLISGKPRRGKRPSSTGKRET